jgi:hypothetical protein
MAPPTPDMPIRAPQRRMDGPRAPGPKDGAAIPHRQACTRKQLTTGGTAGMAGEVTCDQQSGGILPAEDSAAQHVTAGWVPRKE